MVGFRTSRVAEQSARLANALAARKSTRLSAAGNDIVPSNAPSEVPDIEADGHSPPSTPVVKAEPQSHNGTPASRKRKRGVDGPNTPVVTKIKKETVLTRSSPRKTPSNPSGAPKKTQRQPAKRIRGADGDISFEPPPNWQEVYEITKQMRSQVLAPVDTMGCENLAEDTRTPRERRFQTLVALMLSSQTKDTVTAVAMKNLQDNLPGGFTLESILAVEPVLLNELITKVGFHNNKTKFIKATALILRDQHGSDIPDTIEGMVALPGVGPKMAYLCMSAAWGRDEGIGVDVHVHRITNLWGWHKTNNPEETRAILESWLPKDKWHDINHLLVGFGQTWCPPVGRKCDECHLAARGLCPSAVIGKKTVKKTKVQDIVIKEEDKEHIIKSEMTTELEIKPLKAEDLSQDTPLPRHDTTTRDIEDIGSDRDPARLVA